MTTTPDWRHVTFGVVFPTVAELNVLRCPFHIEAQSRDSIPVEHTTNAFHYVSGQEIPGTKVWAPWMSYYTKLTNAPITIANYGGIWFETAMHNWCLTAICPAQSKLGVTHLIYQGMNLQALVDSGEPTPVEIRRQSRPPSRANSIQSNVERDDTMAEWSSTAKGKTPWGTGDNPFGIEDLYTTTDQPQWGRLEGNPPEKFDGKRNDTNDFLMRFCQFMSLNRDTAIARDPIKKATYFLSFMKGNKTKGWTRMQSEWLQDVEEGTELLPRTWNAWQVVKHNFKQAFINYAIKEKAQDKLHKLCMKEGNIDQYITDFQLLAMDTNVDLDEPTVLQLFYFGLPAGLAEKCIFINSPNNFDSWAKAAQKNQWGWILNQTLWQKLGSNPPPLPHQNNQTQGKAFPWNRGKRGQASPRRAPPFDPNAMDVNAVRKATTEAEKQKHRQEGRCFECSLQGHITQNCPQRKQWPQVNKAFSSIVDNQSIAGTEDSDLNSISSVAMRIKGMSEEEKEEFICLMNNEEQDFAKAWVL